MWMVSRISLILLMVIWVWSPRAAGAQETVNTASIAGRVTDAMGGVVVGAKVEARHLETNVVSGAETGNDGRFRLSYLRVGTYSLRVERAGFASSTQQLALSVGSAFEVPVVLAVGPVVASVSVEVAAPVLETARTQIAGTISRDEVDALPLNGRQFLDLALLIPGVSPTNLASTQLFPETSAVAGVGLSVGSQRNFSNNFIVDGVSANDDAAGLSGMPFSLDAIEAFQVVTSGGQAELGRALGGYVNVVTKSGSNTFRGDVYGYFKDDRFNAANALSHATLPMSQQQFGASVGGPVTRDRTFFFGNAEARRLNQTGLVTITPASVQAVNARLAATGYPGATVATGAYANPVHSWTALGKVDHAFAAGDQFGVRYAVYDVSSGNARGTGALNAPTASAGLDNRDQSVALSNTLTVTPRIVNETRVQVARGLLSAPPTDPIGPAVSIAGVASFGTLSGSPTGRRNTLTQVVDNVSWLVGGHSMRAGLDLIVNADTITFPRSNRGAYTFSSLPNFLAGTYNTSGFTQTFGATEVHQRNPNLGGYLQDEWHAGASLTMNVGLRYDLQWLESIALDTNNVSPRAGVAWTPGRTGRTVVRGSAGLFFDRVPLRAVANALLSAGNTTDLTQLRQLNVSLSPSQAGAPVFPAILPGPVPLVTLVNLTTMDRQLQNASSRQAGLEVERQLGPRATVSAGYQYLRGRDLIIQINQNVPTCPATGTNNGCRPVAAYANNNQYSSRAQSNYHALQLTFVQRPVRWGHYRASYSLSSSHNNVGENFFSSPIDPFDLMKDWGRSDDDQRHRLTLDGAVQLPRGIGRGVWRFAQDTRISLMLQAYSALPFNITSGVTTLQGTAGRPIVDGAFIPRNAGKGSGYVSANARLARVVRLGAGREIELMAEVFNLTNHVNPLTRNTTFGAGAYPTNPLPAFGQITAVGDPRTWQFGVRTRF